jgi:hypothetical protein
MKLFKRVTQLVEDMDMEGWVISLRKIRGDIEGIDILVIALLKGVETWYQQKLGFRLSGPSLDNFHQLMALVRQ